MPNVQKIVSSSAYDGFKNIPPSLKGSVVFPAQTIPVGQYRTVRTSIALPSSTTLYTVQTQIRNNGVDTRTYLVPGRLAVNYPSNGAIQYQIQHLVYITGGFLYVDTYIVNQSGSPVVLPSITFQTTAFLYRAPF